MLAVPVDSLLSAAEERYTSQAYDSARDILKVEISRARTAADSAAEARALMWLGLAEWRLGDYVPAREHANMALAMKRHLGMDGELSRSFNALGLIDWNEGKHNVALVHFDSAVAAARRNNDKAGMARAAANIPLVKIELGDFDGARRGFDEALKIGEQIGDVRTQANSLANMAMLDIRLGDPRRAIDLLGKARALYARIDYQTGEANALGQLATAWSELGDLQRAIAAADSAIQIARAKGLQQEVAASMEVLADLQLQSGNAQLALNNLAAADSIDHLLGLDVERGINLRRSAAILLDVGDEGGSLRFSRAALLAHQQSDARAEDVFDRVQLSEALLRTGDVSGARASAATAAAEARTIGSPLGRHEAALEVARIDLHVHKPRAALGDLDASDANVAATDWRAEDLRAESWLALGQLEEARRHERLAIAVLERTRASLGGGPLRATFLGSRVGPYSRFVSIALAMGDTGAAFTTAASVPGRAVAERMGWLGDTEQNRELIGPERTLLRVSALEQQLTTAYSSPEGLGRTATLERELASARAGYEQQLAVRAPSMSSNALGLSAVSLSSVTAALNGDQALLLFLAGPNAVDLFVVRQDGVHHHALKLTDRALAARTRVIRGLMLSRQKSLADSSLEEFFQQLAGAEFLRELIGVNSLLVVPHAGLDGFPFGALRDKTRGVYLAQDYAISYLPSASAIDRNTSALGSINTLSVFAPTPDSLPGTGTEARAISRLLPGTRVLLGESSTERGVREALEMGRSIHIASHGAENPQNPLFSRIVVGRHHSGKPSDDGRLEVHEILGLRTSSNLVFLSGCETGTTPDQLPFSTRSDEASLAQAFLFAGARNVVATLWRINDTTAASIATSFYKRVRDGHPPDIALAETQRDAIGRRGDFGWAAYTISGMPSRNVGAAVRRTRSKP